MLPALLGGVLKGEMRSSSDLAGSKLALGFATVSIDCGFEGIFGLPARLTGGGMGGADAVGRSFLRGSPDTLEPVAVAESGFASGPGVPFLLPNFQGFDTTGGEGESSAAWDVGRDGRGERMGGVILAGGDLGDWTVTLGGERVRERVGDLGGEKATMDVGRGLGLLHGARSVDDRGVGLPLPLSSLTLGEVRPMWSLGMSSDMRPSVLRLSSDTARRSAGPGERWRGVAGAGAALFALRRFSNCALREDTGFYAVLVSMSTEMFAALAPVTYDGLGLVRIIRCIHGGFRVRSSWSASTGRGPAALHRPPWSCSHWAPGGGAGGAELGAAVMRGGSWEGAVRVWSADGVQTESDLARVCPG